MKKILLTIVLLMAMGTASAQTPTLGVSTGDVFSFTLTEFTFDYTTSPVGLDQATSSSDQVTTVYTSEYTDYSTTSSDYVDEIPTAITFVDDGNGNEVVISKGDTFTIEILGTTLEKSDWGGYEIPVKYTKGGVSVETTEWVEFGGLLTTTNWDETRSMMETEFSEDTDDGESVTFIDTDDEFGLRFSESWEETEGEYSYSRSGAQEIRYEKSTGVVNYIDFNSQSTYNGPDENTKSTYHVQLIRSGYNLPDTGAGLALPGFEFYIIAPIVLAIPFLRRKFA